MMGLLSFLFPKKPATAGIAKERLQVVLAHERAGRQAPDFLPALQRDVIAAIGRYVVIAEDLVQVSFKRRNGASVLELNVEFDPTATPVVRPPEPSVRPSRAMPPRRGSAGKRR